MFTAADGRSNLDGIGVLHGGPRTELWDTVTPEGRKTGGRQQRQVGLTQKGNQDEMRQNGYKEKKGINRLKLEWEEAKNRLSDVAIAT